MKKVKIFSLLLTLTLITTPFSTVKANYNLLNDCKQITNDNTLDLRLDTIVVHTEYNQDKVTIEREELFNGDVKVVIKDIVSNETIETITEMNESISSTGTVRALASSNYSTKAVKREKQIGPVVLTFMMHFKVYSSGSFRQIEETIASDFYISSSCPMSLENVNTSVVPTNGSYPATSISYLGTGVVTSVLTVETSTGTVVEGGASFKISEFIEAGFSVSVESSTSKTKTYYLRKSVQLQGTYSVY